MKILTQLVLRFLSPWGVFTSISSLAGVYTNSDQMQWYLWEASHPLFKTFKNAQALALEDQQYVQAYNSLKEIEIDSLALKSQDDIAHYYNNLAYVARLSKTVPTSVVNQYLREAISKATIKELITTIEHNYKIVG